MRIKSTKLVTLAVAVPVYDLTVPGTENFALAAGPFVHNSKDVADSMCGVHKSLMLRRSTWRTVTHVMQDQGHMPEKIGVRPEGNQRPRGRPNRARPQGRNGYVE